MQLEVGIGDNSSRMGLDAMYISKNAAAISWTLDTVSLTLPGLSE